MGSGVAGLTAAYVASRSAHVTLFEADDRLGGHADTHLVDGLAIDTGFIVHNPRTYPVLLRLFAELGVETQPSEMSMSIRDDETGLEWAGALGLRGLFPTGGNLRQPRYLRMLAEIPGSTGWPSVRSRRSSTTTLREFLDEGRFSAYFVRHFMEPLVAAVWSCDPEVALDYPARYLFTFLEHHGMLCVFGSPQWRTVTGGSHEYVRRVAAQLAEVRLGTKVTSVLETPTGVEITDGNGEVAAYDGVVIATHPAQALSMLAAPTSLQRALLEDLPYSSNTALLHTDTSLLPSSRNAWASWNFCRPGVITYDLTRLQRLPTDTRYLVTLGGEHLVDPSLVIDRMEYEHPLYNPTSVAAQRRLPEINTDRVAFAGAYHGWGFHEDGARSGLAAAERLGLAWPESGFEARCARASTTVETPAIYDATIRHTRRKPFRRAFTHRSHTWLVELDDLPDTVCSGGSRRATTSTSTRFLAEHDLDVAGGRVLMAANARAFGYCFNPISVFWCWDADGDLAATVVEVHNTYGDRHAYLVHSDEQGRATVPKAMYVSPFHGTDGTYELAVPVPGERLDIAVTLVTDDGAKFSASLSGRRSTAGPLRAAPAALRGALLIRLHGIWLWLRRLPVRPRPQHKHRQERTK